MQWKRRPGQRWQRLPNDLLTAHNLKEGRRRKQRGERLDRAFESEWVGVRRGSSVDVHRGGVQRFGLVDVLDEVLAFELGRPQCTLVHTDF